MEFASAALTAVLLGITLWLRRWKPAPAPSLASLFVTGTGLGPGAAAMTLQQAFLRTAVMSKGAAESMMKLNQATQRSSDAVLALRMAHYGGAVLKPRPGSLFPPATS